jgi:hypothetical protein
MFAAMESGSIQVVIKTKDSSEANIIVTNKSDKPLSIEMPAAFAAVPVMAQGLGMGLPLARRAAERAGGTAVAGTWLAGAPDMEVEFFVDEDPGRIGAKHLSIPIISPGDAAEGSDVFVGMAPAVSKRLAGKYSDAAARFHAVKSLDAL